MSVLDGHLNIYFTMEISENYWLRKKGFYFGPASDIWILRKEDHKIMEHIKCPEEDYVLYTHGEPNVILKRKKQTFKRLKSIYESFAFKDGF